MFNAQNSFCLTNTLFLWVTPNCPNGHVRSLILLNIRSSNKSNFVVFADIDVQQSLIKDGVDGVKQPHLLRPRQLTPSLCVRPPVSLSCRRRRWTTRATGCMSSTWARRTIDTHSLSEPKPARKLTGKWEGRNS